MINKAFYDALNGESSITDQLDTYQFTTGAAETAAIFTSATIPKDAPRRCIHIGQVTGSPWGTRDSKGGEVLVDVTCWGDNVLSDKALETLAWDVQYFLTRNRLTITGYHCVLHLADPPRRTEDDDGFPGYIITCRLLILEN